MYTVASLLDIGVFQIKDTNLLLVSHSQTTIFLLYWVGQEK